MLAPTYWLNLFSHKTWQEFLAAGGNITGFRERRRSTVAQVREGDYFLCYLTGVSRWIGLLEARSSLIDDDTPIWADDPFPVRVRVAPVVTLTAETAIPIFELRDQLSFFQNLSNPHGWTGWFRGSPKKFQASDGKTIVAALEEARQNPVSRPVDPAKLKRRPPALTTKLGPVTIPPKEETEEKPVASTGEESSHTEIQWNLLKLGNDMGLDVWAARNDKGRSYKGRAFADLTRMRDTLPIQFDAETNRIIEMIDVLWLEGNAIVAAFEIESTTSIYSGLLRMSDLLSMQPNLSIPLYLVAPDDRRNKVVQEVNRATFSRLSPPLRDVCRLLTFSAIRDGLPKIEAFKQHLNPKFLEEWSEVCEPEDT